MADRGRSSSAWLENLRQPMPLGKKLALILRNRVLRFPPPPCCGHPGDPGC